MTELSQEFDIFIDREDYVEVPNGTTALTREWSDTMIIHQVSVPANNVLMLSLEQLFEFEVDNNSTNVTANVDIETTPVNFTVFIK